MSTEEGGRTIYIDRPAWWSIAVMLIGRLQWAFLRLALTGGVGPGLVAVGHLRGYLEATRLTYEDANLTSATGSPRAAHPASSSGDSSAHTESPPGE